MYLTPSFQHLVQNLLLKYYNFTNNQDNIMLQKYKRNLNDHYNFFYF
jgi:hypothetical protein